MGIQILIFGIISFFGIIMSVGDFDPTQMSLHQITTMSGMTTFSIFLIIVGVVLIASGS